MRPPSGHAAALSAISDGPVDLGLRGVWSSAHETALALVELAIDLLLVPSGIVVNAGIEQWWQEMGISSTPEKLSQAQRQQRFTKLLAREGPALAIGHGAIVNCCVLRFSLGGVLQKSVDEDSFRR